MTATDALRHLLDERGVEWEDGGEGLTIIPVQDGVPRAWTVNTWPSGKDMGDCLWVENRHPLTPAQAVEATLGRETCRYVVIPNVRQGDISLDCFGMRCSACERVQVSLLAPRYCPSCGRRVTAWE